MSLVGAVLANRHAVWASVIAIAAFGAVAYVRIPVRLFPETAPPLVNVMTPWPGAAASDVSSDLSRVLEEEFASLEGMARVASTSQDNLSLVTVEFQYGTIVELAAVEVQNAIARIGDDLPEGIGTPRVMTFSTADRPVYTVGIAGDDLVAARRLAEDVVAPRLQQVDGVAAVDVFGGGVPAVLVDVDPAAAEAWRLPLPLVAQRLVESDVAAPAGRLRGTDRATMLRVDQRAERAGDLGDHVLVTPEGAQVHLADVASVRRHALDDDAWFSLDGQRAIAVQVFRSDDANTVAVVDGVREVVADLAEDHPEVAFVPGEESATFTEQSVSNLLENVWQALLLASVLLFLFLGRAGTSLVTIVSMPLSYGITFAAMNALGMEFNMVTLSAVILAVGMVVDASVVVLENIVRLRDEEGVSATEAAVRGTDEVLMPVLAGVATTLMVLVPLLALRGFVGRVFGPLSTTLLLAFSASVVVALFVVPALSVHAQDAGRLDVWARWLARPFAWANDRLRDGYLAALGFGLRRPGLVLGASAVSFVAGMAGLRGAGMDVLPRMDSGAFSVSLETPSGTSLERTAEVMRQVETVLADEPDVVLVQAQAGYEPGMRFTGASGVMGPSQGYASVVLTPRTEREATVWEIEERVRGRVARIPGIARVTVKEVGNTAKPTVLAPLVVRASGPDPAVLDRLGDDVVALLAPIPGVVEPTRAWHRDLRRLVVRIDEHEAAARGQSVLGVSRLLAGGTEGLPAGTFSRPGESPEPVRVRYARGVDPSADEVLDWPLFVGASGEVVPVRSVASVAPRVEQGLFTREDLSPTLDVLAQVDGRPLSFVVADADAALAGLVVPEGYTVGVEGENNDLIESRAEILRALAVSVLGVYLLLVAQFRSFVHPVLVMAAIPLSMAGVSLGLTLAGKPVSMPVMIGLVLLVGTVVNNSILLVEVIRQLRASGVEVTAAIRESVRLRYRPIMMTSSSTVVGMIPLALEWSLGAERFSPLATAVIGGMTASTLLTMVVVPVLYAVAERAAAWRPWRGAAAVAAVGMALLLAPTPARAQVDDLAEAWAVASGQHPSLGAADGAVEAARAREAAATGRFFPTIDLTARYTRQSEVEPPVISLPITLPDGSTPDPVPLGELIVDQGSLRLTATQPVFAGGALWYGHRAASASVDAARAGRDVARGALWASLAESWYGTALAAQRVGIQERLVEAARAQDDRLGRLAEHGRATEVERLAVSVRRSEAEAQLATAVADLDLARLRLETLVGAEVTAPTDSLTDRTGTLSDPIAEGASPEVLGAQAGAEAATARSRAVRGAALPSVALRFGAQYENPNPRHFPLESEWLGSWDASVVLGWTLDGAVRWSEARAASAEAWAAGERVRAVEEQVSLRVAAERRAMALGAETLTLAGERVRLAERAVEAARTAVDAGRATSLDLLDREADLARAQLAEQVAAFDVLVASERLRVLSGEAGPR